MSVICRKVGNSIAATIPNEIIKKLGIRPGDSMNVSVMNNTIIFTPVKKKLKGEIFLEEFYGKPISEIGELDTEIVDWGEPQGDEEW